jgi:hypothetical protein
LPELETLRQEFQPRGVGFIALSIDHDEAGVRSVAARLGIRMQVATMGDEVLGPLGVRSVPSTIFIDREGVIVAAATGAKSLPSLRKKTQELLP